MLPAERFSELKQRAGIHERTREGRHSAFSEARAEHTLQNGCKVDLVAVGTLAITDRISV